MIQPELRPWTDLDEATRTRLLVGHQRWLDTQPPTCALDTKVERFKSWLAEHGIAFDETILW